MAESSRLSRSRDHVPGSSAAALDRGSHWYLIHCKPRQERRALEHLQRQDFHCYHALRPVERWRDGQRYLSAEPLFPGYLFVQLDRLHDNWYPIRSTCGVNQLVSFNGDPLPVRDEVIDTIRARLAEPDSAETYFRPGERVRITDGPFAELEAVFVANDSHQRVVLLLNMLQQDHQLSFPPGSVRKLG